MIGVGLIGKPSDSYSSHMFSYTIVYDRHLQINSYLQSIVLRSTTTPPSSLPWYDQTNRFSPSEVVSCLSLHLVFEPAGVVYSSFFQGWSDTIRVYLFRTLAQPTSFTEALNWYL